MSDLLSAKFSPQALNQAIVRNDAALNDAALKDGAKSESFTTRSTVSLGGFWGFFGAKAHTSATLGQQKDLFSQLKRELREKYLGADLGFNPNNASMATLEKAADKLNSNISAAEKKGAYRGSDSMKASADVVKLATIKRLEAEIDHLSSKKDACLTPKMIAELKSKAEVQFASVKMSAIEGYNPESKGGRISGDQNFNPLKDYKSLLRGDSTGSKLIRFTKEVDSSKANALPSDGPKVEGQNVEASKLMLVDADNAPAEEGVAERTLSHALASLKQAYFRTSPGVSEVSTKEIAFDRQVSKYVETNLRNKDTGELRELTKSDFQSLEKLAFNGRSTVGRVERPFSEMLNAETGNTANSRYSGLPLDKENGILHLVNDGNPHSVMFIETFDPDTKKWSVTKLDFGYSMSERSEKSIVEKFTGNTLLPGKVMIAEGSVNLDAEGNVQHDPQNISVISEADLKIGKSVAHKKLGFFNLSGKMDDITSIRMPMSEINKMLNTAKAQHQGSNEALQGNTALYHLKGKDLSVADVKIHLAGYETQQSHDMLELARADTLFGKIDEFKSQEAQAKQKVRAEAKDKALNDGKTEKEADAEADAAVSNFKFKIEVDGGQLTLLEYLRSDGVLEASTEELADKTSTDAAVNSLQQKADDFKARRITGAGDWSHVEDGVKGKAAGLRGSIDTLLKDPALSPQERKKLEKLKGDSIGSLTSNIWQNHRAIHQLTQKVSNLARVDAVEGDLKAARKELKMRTASNEIAESNFAKASKDLTDAMEALKPSGWTVTPSVEELRGYRDNGTYNERYQEFKNAAIATRANELARRHVDLGNLIENIDNNAQHVGIASEEFGDLFVDTANDGFQPLAEKLALIKPDTWGGTFNATELRALFQENRPGFDAYVKDLQNAKIEEYAGRAGHDEARRFVDGRLDALSGAHWRAYTPLGRVNSELAQQQQIVAGLVTQYDELSADMVKGSDGYTTKDAGDNRTIRAGNCADWLRNMMRLTGVAIEGIENIRDGALRDAFRTQDPQVLAQGRYSSFRFGAPRIGFRLTANPQPLPPSSTDVASRARTAPVNEEGFLSHRRMNGAQYSIIRA